MISDAFHCIAPCVRRRVQPACDGAAGAAADLMPMSSDLDSGGRRRLWLVRYALTEGCGLDNALAFASELEAFIQFGAADELDRAEALLSALLCATGASHDHS